MAQLKGAILSLRGVLAGTGPIDPTLYAETLKLLRYLKQRGVTPVFATNHDWKLTQGSRQSRFQDVLESSVGAVKFYIAEHGTMEWKPRAGAVNSILSDCGWNNREVIYIGHSDDDMKTASNGNVMFLNALWHGQQNTYGFQFNSPLDVARFVDCLCLGLNNWFWALEQGRVRAYAMAPFSTFGSGYPAAHTYSQSARDTAKSGAGDATFWGRLLAARVYFSGLVDEIDFITSYPGHRPNSPPTVVAEPLSVLAGSLRKKYLPDLIVRHAQAQKSQAARNAQRPVGVENQLNTIHLNARPLKRIGGEPYKNSPLRTGKTVLVVDDFCTQGNSLEAARLFIEATGARSIGLSWLKTINRDYNAVINQFAIQNPYIPVSQSLSHVPVVAHSFHGAIVDPTATSDLDDLHRRYATWRWPASIA